MIKGFILFISEDGGWDWVLLSFLGFYLCFAKPVQKLVYKVA